MTDSARASEPLAERQILIVEPSPTLRKVYAERAQAYGMSPLFRDDTLGALEAVRHHRPAAIISSYELEDFAGSCLVSALKSTRKYAAIPIVILTSRENHVSLFRGHRPDLILRKLGNLRASLDEFFGDIGMTVNEQPHSEAPLLGMRILVAEDSEVQQRFLAQILHVAGAEVDLACNGLEAVEMATANEYNLILMDLQMPEMGGIEAADEMVSARVNAPMIACTAMNELDDIMEDVQNAGFIELINKPFDRLELIQLCMDHHPDELIED